VINSDSKIQLDSSWLPYLENEFNLPYMQSLKAFLQNEKAVGKTILLKATNGLMHSIAHH